MDKPKIKTLHVYTNLIMMSEILSAALWMNDGDEEEKEIATDLLNALLIRVRGFIKDIETEQWGGVNMANNLRAFRINGRAVNKRGLTVGINYEVKATSDRNAVAEANRLAIDEGLKHIRIVYVLEAATHE